ncbi:hypothetical protein DFH09DRAFT_1352920, partial [Mycena vulgaris]
MLPPRLMVMQLLGPARFLPLLSSRLAGPRSLSPQTHTNAAVPYPLSSTLWSLCMSGRRTLHLGKEFSSFDLDLCRVITPQKRFNVAECLREHPLDVPLLAAPPADLPPAAAPTTPPSSLTSPLTAQERNKLKSRARRDKKHDKMCAASDNPVLKAVHRKRVNAAKPSALDLDDLDASKLPHSKPTWLGSRLASEAEFEFSEP